MSATWVEIEPPSDSISQRTRSSLTSLRPDDRDMSTEGGQLVRCATPDTAAAAGEDDDLVTNRPRR